MGVITFNSRLSSTFGIQVEQRPNYELPEKDYEIVHVPGKSGDILIDKGSYKNVDRTYNIAIGSKFREFYSMANDIAKWLCSASGYVRLEDTYEPDYYRLATYKGPGNIVNLLGNAGRATISFNCKPQRFLKSGDSVLTISSRSYINNPTSFTSLPIITVKGTGSGVVYVGAYVIEISSIGISITINSDVQDVYQGSINRNPSVTMSEFPKMIPGDNYIRYTGGVTSVEITPKWWTI